MTNKFVLLPESEYQALKSRASRPAPLDPGSVPKLETSSECEQAAPSSLSRASEQEAAPLDAGSIQKLETSSEHQEAAPSTLSRETRQETAPDGHRE